MPGIGSAATKATEITANTLPSMYVHAYYQTDNTKFFGDVFSRKDNSGVVEFVSARPHYWPESQNLVFEAFHPASLYSTENYYVEDGSHKLNFFLNTSILDQDDFVVGTTTANQSNGMNGVSLDLSHKLSQLRLHMKCTKHGRKIEVAGLRICNVCSAGIYDFTDDGSWTNITTSPVNLGLDMSSSHLVMDGNNPTTTYIVLSPDTDNPLYNEGPAYVMPEALQGWVGGSTSTAGTYLALYVKVTDNNTRTYPMLKSGLEYAWLAIPLTCTLEAGHAYKLLLEFNEGLGYVSPEGANDDGMICGPHDPGELIITNHPVEFVIDEIEWNAPEDDEDIIYWHLKFVDPDVTPWDEIDMTGEDWRDIHPVFEVSAPERVGYKGGTTSCLVKSYSEYVNVDDETNVNYKAEAWTAEFFDLADNSISRPSWFTLDGTSSSGVALSGDELSGNGVPNNATSENVVMRFAALTTEGGNALKNKPVVDYDLSMRTLDGTLRSGMTTANCYVVPGPGTYIFPIVYGNGVVDGNVNEVAFHPGVSASNCHERFLNSMGNGIQSAFISEDGFYVESAEVIWKDVNPAQYALIDNLEIVNKVATVDGAQKPVRYVKFRVPESDNIQQGNAVIAVKNSFGTILWSWHIWVTPEDLSPKNGFMPVNLGWISTGNVSNYVGEGVKVRFTQTSSGLTREVVFLQNGASNSTSRTGYSPYYQWGRKDPFYPMTGITQMAGVKELWNGAGTKIVSAVGDLEFASTNAVPENNIMHPLRLYYVSPSGFGSSPNTMPYNNLWSATNTAMSNTATSAVKTVYDPCPAGFRVPVSSEFGATSGGSFGSNVYTGGGLTFPACGWINTRGNNYANAGTQGCYWEALPASTAAASYRNFASGTNSTKTIERSHALAVRPVAEN